MFRGKLLVAACALIPTLFACGPTDAEFLEQPGSQSSALAGFPDVCEITDPTCVPGPTCDPIYDLGCEPCPRDNPDAWCYEPPCTAADGLINQYTTVYAGREAYETPEVRWFGGSRCNRMVITGIGARIVSDSNYDMLQVEYRQPYADGTLGPPTVVKTGPNASAAYEAWLKVPYGYAIVGVGAGQRGTHDLKTLVIWYRKLELTPAGVRLTGPIETLSWEGTSTGPIDARVISYDDDKVFVGVGFRSAVEQTKTIRVQLGKLP